MEKPKMPLSQLAFGEVIYWLCVLAAVVCTIGPVIAFATVNSNVGNPHYLFQSVFDGNTYDAVWDKVAGGFPGGHFWAHHMTAGDGITQLGLVIGCACALPALIAAAAVFVFKKKERSLFWVLCSVWIAALITVSMMGIVDL